MEMIAGLRTFARVVEAGSLSEAGWQLGIAPSSVSRQINELEDSLGGPAILTNNAQTKPDRSR